MKSLFIVENNHYLPTEHAASPWGPVTLHGGASAGLMTALMEEQFQSDSMQLVRLTVDLFRPVPMGALEPRGRIIRDGKRIKLLEMSLFHEGLEICRSHGLVIEKQDIVLPAAAQLPTAPPQALVDAFQQGEVIGINALESSSDVVYPPGLHNLITLKPVSLDIGTGSGCSWVRLPVNVREGKANSPLVTIATLADFANGFAQLHLNAEQGFINADLTLNLHRLPVDEWIAIDARTLAQPHGISLVETVLYDRRGMIGRVSQSNLTMQTYSK
ncbi:MAG: thioesterase family protein [Candidatus Reddybacter sp.]